MVATYVFNVHNVAYRAVCKVFTLYIAVFNIYIVTCRAVYRQRLREHFPAATYTHAKLEVLLEPGVSTMVRAEGL
jgi:hypothetical protein